MNIPKKTAAYLSLFIIVSYWLYQLFVADHHRALPANFSDFALRIAFAKIVHLTAIVLLLRMEGDGWYDVGFNRKNWGKQLLTGLLFGLIMFLLINIGLSSILESIYPKPADTGSVFAYFSEPSNLYIWLLIGIFGGGLVEELMRIFTLTRFQKRFRQPGLYIALVCSSLVFGLGHLYQGTGAAISTGISGLVLGAFFIIRKSAIELITIHAFSDVLAILGACQLYGHH